MTTTTAKRPPARSRDYHSSLRMKEHNGEWVIIEADELVCTAVDKAAAVSIYHALCTKQGRAAYFNRKIPAVQHDPNAAVCPNKVADCPCRNVAE